MSFTAALPTLLLLALALVMFGLGLSLTIQDFARLREHPRDVLLALVLQMVALPAVAVGLIVLLGVQPIYAVSLPLIANWAIATYLQTGQVVPLQFGKVLEVVGVVMVPVLIGMVVRHRQPGFSERMGSPMKAFSAVVLAFNLASLLVGYYLSRAAGLAKPLATAVSFEIGIHNSTLAIFVALSVLGNLQLGLPAAIYSVSMYLTATAFGFLVLRRGG